MDAAGSMDDEYMHIDMCAHHLRKALQSLVTTMNYDEGQAFVAKWSGRQ